MAGYDDPNISNGNPAGFIRGLLNEGENQTNGLDIYRGAGGHIQDARWARLYQQVASTYADRPAALGIDPFSIPAAGDYETWNFGKGGQFATQVQIQMYDRDLGQYVTRQYTHVTNVPHTGVEAEQAAADQFDPENTGADYNEIFDGAVAVTYATTIPY